VPHFDIQQVLDLAVPLAKGLAQALVILVVGNWLSKAAHRLVQGRLQARGVDLAVCRFLGQLLRYAVLAAAGVSALGVVGIETTSFVAIIGSAGLAVGLALQGSLGNFASGVLILFFRPFTLGDMVTAGGQTGVVADIGMFATTMHTADGQVVIVPNSAITGGTIINLTALGTRRVAVSVGVAYGAELQVVQEVLLRAAHQPSLALTEPAPTVAFVGLGASSLDFNVMAWGRSADFLALSHELRCAVYDELNRAGIEIPFSQIVVHQAGAA